MNFHNERSPFIVFVLYKTSGHFLGIGSIIDKKTVITAQKTVEISTADPKKILVLGGSLSPWWGRRTQVRKVKNILLSKYEVVLLKLKDDWVFDKNVAPIRMPDQFYKLHTPTFGKWALGFGILLDAAYHRGEALPKSLTYYSSINKVVHNSWDLCEALHPNLVIKFDKLIHYCIYPNGSYCHGCIGSPTVGIDKKGDINILGVIIRTSCNEFDLVVKISYLDKWIRSNSLLGYKIIPPVK